MSENGGEPKELAVADLSQSGLNLDDIQGRLLDNSERAATNTPSMVNGYVIPYFSLRGKLLPFYRVKLFEHDPKYKQPTKSSNHIYFPKQFLSTVKGKNYVIITEGEKKATRACKAGFPCIALSGVDSWRNNIVTIPAESALSAGKSGAIKAKIPGGSEVKEDLDQPVAVGFQDLIDYALLHQLTIIIAFDADQEVGIKAQVQRACAVFAFELRFRGIPFKRIRQLIVPAIFTDGYQKETVGIDDFLEHNPKTDFQELLTNLLARRVAFPRHPNIRELINKKLQNPKISRKELQGVALAVLSDLDANGIRLRSPSELTYYFDKPSKRLLKSAWATSQNDGQFDEPFVQHLYKQFGLASGDSRLLVWLGTQFTSEEPIETVTPHRVLAKPTSGVDAICYQLSDSQFASISKTGLKIHDNGTENILFEADQVEPLDTKALMHEFLEQSKQERIPNWWGETLSEARLRDKERGKVATSLLYYMSPWLHRWRGTQLPIEIVVGEAGSGKSTLYELRLNILTGRPRLRNCPQDIKDWYASISNSGGLHVTDNVQLTDKNLRQRLSDEICRIITEPDPYIEQRKYYTNADVLRIPVRAVFGITAIQQPFQNSDVLQRSMILELDKVSGDGQIMFDSEWKQQQLKRHGTRESWIAHHMVVLQRFFQLAEKEWRPNFQATHRLIHFEQCMILMAKVFGYDPKWITPYLAKMTDRVIAENDWVLEGITAFTHARTSKDPIFAQTIAEWAQAEDDYVKCEMLINPRRLGRYMKTHKALIHNLTGLAEDKAINNRQAYRLVIRRAAPAV